MVQATCPEVEEESACAKMMAAIAVAGPADSAWSPVLDERDSTHMGTDDQAVVSGCMNAVQLAGEMLTRELKAVCRIEGIAEPFQTTVAETCWKRPGYGSLHRDCPWVRVHGSLQHRLWPVSTS